MPEQLTMFENDDANYQAFVDKFKPKKTTDDCYTPDNIYRAVAAWVAKEYGLDPATFVRPFWPGADYEAADYPEGCCVVDNPPFSLLARICKFYQSRGVRFFLFAPTLTMFSGWTSSGAASIPVGVQITYANGANVNTSFLTNLDDCVLRTAPDLYQIIKAENAKNEKAMTKKLPKYAFPDHVLTAAAAYRFSKYGIPFRVERHEAAFIRRLDAMKAEGKDRGIFGGAFLLSERAAAERAAATVWQLSDRERAIVANISGTPKESLSQAAAPPVQGKVDFPENACIVPGKTEEVFDPFDLDHLLSMPKEAR